MTMLPHFDTEHVTVWHGDCIDVMRTLPDASVDAVVTDPPYGLGFMGHKWDTYTAETGRAKSEKHSFDHVGGNHNPVNSADQARTRRAEGHKFEAWCEEWALEAYRLLKPGGHLLAFGGTRTFHRLAAGIEDAGFEIRDSIAWLYGSGFPKSLDVSKAIDKAAGAEREVVGKRAPQGGNDTRVGVAHAPNGAYRWGDTHYSTFDEMPDAGRAYYIEANDRKLDITAPATPDAARWSGWGTALKPAFEPIVVARKPLSGTVAANVLAYGTGALNIDASRIDTTDDRSRPPKKGIFQFHGFSTLAELETAAAVGGKCPDGRDAAATLARYRESVGNESHEGGRWPANVILDASQAAALDHQSGVLTSGANPTRRGADGDRTAYGAFGGQSDANPQRGIDTGGASRFFYTAKASTDERPVHWKNSCDCEDAWPTTSHGRATAARTTADASNTTKSGSATTAPSPTATRSTTSTTTNSTTGSRTSSPSPRPTTNASTPDASSATASGGSPAASATSSNPSDPLTGTSAAKAGPSTAAAVPATSHEWFRTSVCGSCGAPAKSEAHVTVKPVDLMRWLVKLVTPKGGVVLEPFAGSGTTVEAAVLEGFRCIAIEREVDYLPLIMQRVSKPHAVGLDFGDWEDVS